jgi:hypothetical protein
VSERELIAKMLDFLNIADRWVFYGDPDTFYRFMDKLYFINRRFLSRYIRSRSEAFTSEQKAIIAAYYETKGAPPPVTAKPLPRLIDISHGTALHTPEADKYNVRIPA